MKLLIFPVTVFQVDQTYANCLYMQVMSLQRYGFNCSNISNKTILTSLSFLYQPIASISKNRSSSSSAFVIGSGNLMSASFLSDRTRNHLIQRPSDEKLNMDSYEEVHLKAKFSNFNHLSVLPIKIQLDARNSCYEEQIGSVNSLHGTSVTLNMMKSPVVEGNCLSSDNYFLQDNYKPAKPGLKLFFSVKTFIIFVLVTLFESVHSQGSLRKIKILYYIS